MLLWTPPNDGFDEDEKGGKLHRETIARSRKILLGMALVSVAFIMTIATLTYDRNGVNSLGSRQKIRARGKMRDLEIRPRLPPTLPEESIYRLSVEDHFGEMVSLLQYAGNVTLVVNTACKWGKTSLTFQQLEVLQERYQGAGFTVLAFPTNDFRQEFDTNEEIGDFIQQEFPDVSFPVFGISSLRENPVYRQLKEHLPDQEVHHNFFKYLVGPNGIAVDLYSKKEDPLTLEPAIEKLLKEIYWAVLLRCNDNPIITVSRLNESWGDGVIAPELDKHPRTGVIQRTCIEIKPLYCTFLHTPGHGSRPTVLWNHLDEGIPIASSQSGRHWEVLLPALWCTVLGQTHGCD
jgi:glutathione peroxidase